MDQTVYISSKNTATFRCPACGRTKIADVSQYVVSGKKIAVNCTCVCSHRFRCRLEFRKQYRKAVRFPGKFACLDEQETPDSGLMTVVDISSSGVKLQLNVPRPLAVGAALRVEFHLDNRQRTLISRRVIVRNVSGTLVGASFHPDDADDRELGFYLMS